jgi:serine/threonine protein kinase/Tol biopolymer transport system component
MEPDRWHRVGELYHSALRLAQDRRAAFLHNQCQGDEELRQEVESLLSCESAASAFIESPAFELAAQLIAKDQAGESSSDTIGFGAVSPRFQVLEKVGAGGMGVVYKAEDRRLRRSVALKFLPSQFLPDPQALERFQREAYAASALNHPNICTIYDVDEYRGQPFITMELLEGQTLESAIAAQPVSLPELLNFAIQICNGLEAAHAKGIIHRDIKPSNIFITTRAQAKILDFGLAKLQDSETESKEQSRHNEASQEPKSVPNFTLTRTGVTIGTAGYMSPEQIRAEKLDVRTDLFSFGLVLYEMATGQRAFRGDTGPVLHKAILTEAPVPVRQLNPRLPNKLGQIITKALEKDRTGRYQTAPELRADLELVNRQILPTGRFRWFLIASVSVFTLMVVAAFYWFENHLPQSISGPANIKFRQLTTNSPENPVTSGSISRNGRYLAYVDTQGIHIKDVESSAVKTLAQPVDLQKDSVKWEIIDASWLSDDTRFLANAHPQHETQDMWSSRTTDIWIFSRLNPTPHKLREHAIGWSASPDGTLISFGAKVGKFGDREIWLAYSDGRPARKFLDTDENSSMGVIGWTPDSNRIVYVKTDAKGDSFWSRDIHGGPATAFAAASELPKNIRGDTTLLPDGRLIYQLSEPGSGTNAEEDTCNFWAMRVDPYSGKMIEKPTRLTNWTGFCISNANATADGKRIAFLRGATQWSVNVADVGAGGARISNVRRLTLDESWNMTQDWTNDSKSVVFTSNRSGHFAIYKQSLQRDQPELISTGPDSFRDTPATPDGKWVFAIPWPKAPDQNSSTGLMRIPLLGGQPEFVTTTLQDGVFCARPPSTLCVLGERTEDRRRLIFTSVDPLKGRGTELARFDLNPQVEYFDFDLSPDGTRLAISGSTVGPIHILSLRGQPERVIPASFDNAQEFHWAADGKGLYVPDQTRAGTILFYLDLQGKTHELWKQRGGGWMWARPSPDGRHLAIETSSTSNNAWMMENF